MTICQYCGKEIGNLPYKCKFCKNYYCSNHRLPENHECIGDLKLKPIKSKPIKKKPIKQYNFQDNYEPSYDRYTYDHYPPLKKHPRLKNIYSLSCILVIIATISLSSLYSIHILEYWMQVVTGHLMATFLAFGLAIMLPLFFANIKNRSRLYLSNNAIKAFAKLVILSEIMIFIIGLMAALQYAFSGMGDFVTVFWTFIGLANLFLYAIYLEIKARIKDTVRLEIILKNITKISSIIVFLNILVLILLGVLTSLSIIAPTSINYFLEFYWIYFSLYVGFHVGRIVTRW